MVADVLVMAEKSDWQQSIDDYLQNNPGMTEEDAKKQAFLDAAISVGWDMTGGALSGGIMGGGASAIKNISAGVQQPQSTTQSGANAQGGNGQTAQEAAAEPAPWSPEWIKETIELGRGVDARKKQQSPSILENFEETLALGRGDPADPVAAAVEAFKENGTVTNKLAEAILNRSKAVARLREQVGLQLPDTASGRRNAIKAAVEQLAQVQSETIDEAGVTDGFTGMSGLTYNAEQADLLASLSTTAIQNATDLYGKKDITFNDIGISDAETRQAWIDAGLAYEETSPDGTKYIAVQSEMLMDERARRREAQRQTTVDTETQAGYDNENNQGGVANGTGEETQTVYRGGTEGAFGIQGKTRTEASDRSGVQEILGEATERSAQTVSNQKNDRLNDKPLLYDKAAHITPKTGSLLENVQRTFMHDYGIECYIIKDSAWRERDPACSRHGRVYIQESIDEATLSTAVPHESTHAMRQLGFSPYMDFFPVVQDSIISGSENGQKLLYLAGAQCGIDPLAISTDEEYYRFYSELNAIVYGLERAGIIDNPNFEFGYIPSAFHNYNSYIAELDSIHEQFRQQVKAERSAAEGQANESVGAATAWFDPNTRLQYENGTIPEGENPVRSDDLPKKDYTGKDVSRTARTVKGAKVTPDEFVDLLNKETVDGGLSYVKIANDATVQKAIDHISNEGWEAAKAQWQADVHNGKAGHSPKYIKNAWMLMSAAIHETTRRRPDVMLPEKEVNEKPYLDPEQIDAFVAAVKGHGQIEIAALMELSSLRRSKMLAVKPEHIDFKTGTSRRTVPIIPPLLEALQVADLTGEYVINLTGGWICTKINEICRKNGLPEVGNHGLRHSFASLAYHLQIPEKIALEIGGWKDTGTMHKIYTHLAKKDIANRARDFTNYFRKTDTAK